MNNDVKKAIAQLKKVNDAVEKKAAGRPVDPTSINQQLKAAREALKEAGIEVKRGRPVDESSERQQRLRELELRKQANGGVVQRGRPVDENSERQKKLNEQLAKLQARLASAGVAAAATPESED
jgi:predicted outer membrane protein